MKYWLLASFICLCSFLFLGTGMANAANSPCAPGVSSIWAPSAKDFLGTSLSKTSNVYFTGGEGILTEVFYPTVDTVQNVDLQFLITDAAKTWGDEERKQKQHQITQVNKRSMVWQAVTTDDDKRWKITKKFFTDPDRPTVIQRVTFETLEAGKTVKDYNVYLLNNPAINNSGSGTPSNQPLACNINPSTGPDNSRTLSANGRTFLAASQPNSTASALGISLPWKSVNGVAMVSNGFVGTTDGYTDLFGGSNDKTMSWQYDGAYQGNVAQMGWVDFSNSNASSISFDVVLGFGSSETDAMNVANATLTSDLGKSEIAYTQGWLTYTQGLKNQGGRADDQYYLAAMTLKTIQDKSNGAMIAGLGTPWGEGNGDANQGGYHLVWSRDLFKFASSLIAAGDTASANQAVDYLFNVQMQTTNSDNPYARAGRFPQNTFVSGKIWWNGSQMDETAMPIILAWKLNRTDLWSKIKLAAEFLAHNGPYTGQERWEEMAGYSPSTIAAEIAGLVTAADLATKANDPEAAKYYLKIADGWRNNVANWTFTTNGSFGNKKYYVRLTDNKNPNDGDQLTFGNGGGKHDQRDVIDGGFLELVRMGTMSPNDWTILETIPEYDAILKQTLSNKGDAWFRYNFDGYGETNSGDVFNDKNSNQDRLTRGRLWPIFTAERGIYEIAKSGDGSVGKSYDQALKAFSSEAGFIPEQIWNQDVDITGWNTTTPSNYQVGTATRSMRPLSWAMGEYINLVVAMNEGKGDAPNVVCQRYACDKAQTNVTFNVNANTNLGENIYLVGNSPLLSNWEPSSGIKLSSSNYPIWSVTVSLPASTAFEYKFVKLDSQGNTVWQSGQNHTFTTPSSGNTTLSDTFS
ncbi:carbohydrate-binding module family 20 domain-containing protein [Pseudanabaena catenata USMAC16]|uniref:Carbohydrate-binding module family 20 domain-containing protein n=2 Tax=Pseudanabaena TaxID=1152 RepID=A0A9X4M637_9CYAN|nr:MULTISPECIES: glycoside hydrolase family 15 protein [Pseudanabaena]MDG3493413.1 carbohydrate-binding module family 20 domain-containing protein [Pseudanabaena catenata USMAC16]